MRKPSAAKPTSHPSAANNIKRVGRKETGDICSRAVPDGTAKPRKKLATTETRLTELTVTIPSMTLSFVLGDREGGETRTLRLEVSKTEQEKGDRFPRLTPGEYRVCELLKLAKRDQEIADELKVSLSAVRSHNRNIFRKLGISSRSELLPKNR